MSLARRVARGARLISTQPRAQAATVVEHLFDGMYEGGTEAGEQVSVEKAAGLPAVFKAIRLCSETAGALPLITYRDRGEERERDTDHPAYGLLHEEPNPGMTAAEFWTVLLAHFFGWGRLFIGKEFDFAGRVRALHPIEPKKVRVERLTSGELLFHERRLDGRERTWTQRQLIYVRLFTLDGVTGLSPIGLQRETMGFALAIRKHGARFFNDAAIPAGALQVKEEIKDPAVKEALRQEWKARHQGRRDIAVLDAGAEFKPISVPVKDVQFVELWGATRGDVADAFNMPPSLLSGPSGDSLTYGNRQDDLQQFLTLTLHNPLKKVEQALTRDRDLFPRPDGRRSHYSEFLREDLLRPDSKARAAFYRMALDPKAGWMRREEVRRLENLPREDGSELERVDEAARAAARNGNGHHPDLEVHR